MQQLYTIQTAAGNDGPHDLVTLLRRIRSGKITKDTLIIEGETTTAVPAGSIREISVFFDSSAYDAQKNNTIVESVTLAELTSRAWQFVSSNHIITVYAGLLMMLCLITAIVLSNYSDTVIVFIVTWFVFSILHNIYLVGVLSSYRGHKIASNFLARYFMPTILTLVMASLTLAAMMFGGLLALVVPGIAVAVMYLFVPFLIVDKRYGLIAAMVASRLLVQKAGKRYAGTLTLLVFLHLLCLICIIPIPLTLPLFAVIISDIYEEMINA
ncbi:MAG: hypothetical protein LW823_03900 [Rickettsiales bacterium]|jgi:hypothetical protein|nr:hypothetical protein [Rickettsiales bacterium]